MVRCLALLILRFMLDAESNVPKRLALVNDVLRPGNFLSPKESVYGEDDVLLSPPTDFDLSSTCPVLIREGASLLPITFFFI